MPNSITDIPGITVGSQEDLNALTGCTVILTGDKGATCGVDVRGSGPGTRETDLLSPINMIEKVHGILLTGGSAYGLEAAGGIMQFLEEKGIGYNVGPTVVPIIPGAVLFDLAIGDHTKRPDKQMGYLACQAAGIDVKEGNYGAGAGATVGKINGKDKCTKSGLGTYSIKLDNGVIVGAIVAVNAFGDVFNTQNGKIIAGVRDDSGKIIGTEEAYKKMANVDFSNYIGTNTTIGVVASNASFNKSNLTKIAQMAHNGLARVINPIHTMCDGDTIFALSKGDLQADINVVGYLAQEALKQAVLRAVQAAETIKDCRSYKD
ncbi:endo-type 6-aminohexanoate oligomer hydrolase [Candidatus Syntrophocurvum alkaliphilum]|uniref:Endo-type 6-aminohexanoate oligomer hydrolase n=1 Tax=Candidatus Syntrophocurvum alkaliphilum TaxID=2293317 RepID=A0A6I6DD81_9FIRM|nr:P1 family peptidase [Candidatus Syntrophocurvum alkaliphilum]QGU00502.1 endo-type 6-aminohexanoate oligomer hydrolase [Candidatus Syntrophocurvum alkaliphilum]